MLMLFAIAILYNLQLTRQYILSTAQGKVRGTLQDGYVAYRGIPYASVPPGPTGIFKRGGVAPVWADIRESRDSRCTSSSTVDECLQLDVNVPTGSYFPVLVWVTGGAGRYDPAKLVKNGIIVVVVRHRLGPQGFLCSSDSKIPGNAGLKDVIVALRWVKDNIVAFNGNPNKVVVAGQSFGAAMVESLLLTPTTHGLFHGVILQSGTVLAPWAFNYDAESRARLLRSKFNTSRELSVITRADPVLLATKSEELDLPYLPFAICLEKPFKNEERVLSASPFKILSEGNVIKVPMIIGYTNNEAYIFASMLRHAKVLKRMTREMWFLLPAELQSNKSNMGRMMNEINEMYFEDNMTMKSVLAYHRDIYFLSHIHKSVKFHSYAQNTVYYYQFSYFGQVGVEVDPIIMKSGAAHSDELAYLFPDQGQKLDGDDTIVQENLIRLWTHFVKYLNPTPANMEPFTWSQFDPGEPKLLDITTDLEMIEFPYERETQMWNNIYEKYYFDRRN